MDCPNCQEKIFSSDKFCGKCGFQLPTEVKTIDEIKKPEIAYKRRNLIRYSFITAGLILLIFTFYSLCLNLLSGNIDEIYLNKEFIPNPWGREIRIMEIRVESKQIVYINGERYQMHPAGILRNNSFYYGKMNGKTLKTFPKWDMYGRYGRLDFEIVQGSPTIRYSSGSYKQIYKELHTWQKPL